MLLLDNTNVSSSPHLHSDRSDQKDVSASDKFPQGDWFAHFYNYFLKTAFGCI